MEEKKSIKVSLGTAICIFIIVLLFIALGLAYYLGFIRNNERINELESEKNNLNQQLNIIYEKNNKENNQSIINSAPNKETDNSIIKLVQEADEKTTQKGVIHEIRVRKISKTSDNRYLINADYNIPVEITEEEYKDLVKTGDCEKYLGFTGTYNKNSEKFTDEEGYGFVVLASQDFEGTVEYQIVKTDTGYSFIYPVGAGYPMSKSTEVEIYLEEDDIIYVENIGEKTLKEYARILDEKLSQEEIPIVTVKYDNDKLYLFEASK